MSNEIKILFIGNIPLFYSSKSVAKQLRVESWLDLTLLKNLIEEAYPAAKQSKFAMRFIV